MNREEFRSKLRGYEAHRLRGAALPDPQTGLPTFPGYMFVYAEPDRVDLMLDGRRLGSATWRPDRIAFDPPLTLPTKQRAFEEDLEEWVSLAENRRQIERR